MADDAVKSGAKKVAEKESPPEQKPPPVDPAALKPRPPKVKTPRYRPPSKEEGDLSRRTFVWYSFAGFFTVMLIAFGRFFFPRVLFEPKTKFPIGFPDEYGFGVDTKWQQKFRIWVCRNAQGLYVIYARCTHLGCTPDWKPSENKFKCPCHGSGFDSEGVNYEGPAPKPMLRCHLELDPRGRVVVDTLRLYEYEDFRGAKASSEGPLLAV